MLQFVCECDVVKDTGKEEYLRPFIHIGLDWIGADAHNSVMKATLMKLPAAVNSTIVVCVTN